MTKKQIRLDYQNRINRVFDFIEENLESDLSLSKVAENALYSPFHFHRVFKYITGETLNDYVSRQRIEKSALDLLHKSITVSELAHKFGFSDNSSFSRAFKKYFGVSPTEFKKQNSNKHSKIRQLQSKIGQVYPTYEEYICIIDNLNKWIDMKANIEIKETPVFNLAGITHLSLIHI